MNAYEYIKKELNQTKTDLMFKPELLDELTDKERLEIELEILSLINKGNRTSFKYIPFLKKVDIHNNINKLTIKQLNPYYQAEIYKYLYLNKPNTQYIIDIINLAMDNIQVYSLLIFMYDELENGTRIKAEVFDAIVDIKDKNQGVFLEMYNKRMGDRKDLPEPNSGENGPMFHVRNNFTSEEHKQTVLNNLISLRNRLIKENRAKQERLSIKDSLYGFIVGDAFGVPVEFQSRKVLSIKPVTSMLEYGSHHVPKGTWSDDSSMTLATMDSIAKNPNIDYEDMMHRFIEWSEKAEYTATDIVFDIGITTSSALRNFMYQNKSATEAGLSDIRSNGNGSLMRILPISLYVYTNIPEEDKKVEIINNASSLTHAHEISKMGCYIYTKFIEALLKGSSKEEAYKSICSIDYSKYYSEETIKVYERILNGNLKSIGVDDISSSGYVVSTLEAVLWTILNTNSFQESIIKSVNLGNDTDTVGAITGSLAGILYGYSSIPKEWLDAIPKQDYLNGLITEYDKVLNKEKNNSIKL